MRPFFQKSNRGRKGGREKGKKRKKGRKQRAHNLVSSNTSDIKHTWMELYGPSIGANYVNSDTLVFGNYLVS